MGGVDGDVFGIDVGGWVEQHRSREPYEVVREPIQNALDTETDLYVRIHYGDRYVVVEDFDEAGVEELSQFYDLFAGDKYSDPEKRGRFGRGIKEFIGATDETVISSTAGALRFTFDAEYDAEWDEVAVDASRYSYPDAKRACGTVVYGTNTDWTLEEFQTVEKFIEGLWMPENQDLTLDVYDTDGELVRESMVTHRESDVVLDHQHLPTLVVEDGVQSEARRWAEVEVMKTNPGDGGIFEMGIPVTKGEAFPFLFNVQQKVPVTERRNELDNTYRAALMRGVINEGLDQFDDPELAEEYVTQYISRYSHNIQASAQEEYIRRRFGTDPDSLLVYTSETPSVALAWAVQQGLPNENADEYCRNVRELLTSRCPSVQEWYSEMCDERLITVIDDPAPKQEALIEYFESEIMGRSSARGVTFELALISGGTENEQVHATYSPRDEVVYLNALVDEWDEPSPRRIGTALHELGHHESPATDHGRDWYHTVEELSGEVIQSLQIELDDQTETDTRDNG